MAYLFLRVRCVLEHDRRRIVRFHDQPSHRTLLHARVEHDTFARSCGFVWSVWHAWDRPNARVSPSIGTSLDLARRMAAVFVLGDERRSISYVCWELASSRSRSNLGV